MKKLNRKIVLSLMSLAALSSCAASTNVAVAAEDETEIINTNTQNAASTSIISSLINIVAERGSSIITKEIDNWGLAILNNVFKAVGLDFLVTSSQPDYSSCFKEINDRLTAIENTLQEIKTSIDQKEATRVMDNFRNTFDTIKTAIDPIISGLADCADREKAATTDAEKEAILQEEVYYYENYVKNLEYTNSFAERVITLAKIITAPSSNAQNTLMRCFNVTALDMPGIYPWDSMRVNSQTQFLAYVTTTLLKAMSVARYEISYRHANTTLESEKTFWSTTNDELNEAVTPALDLLQKEMNTILENQKSIDSGTLTHIATGIKVNKRLGVTSFDQSKGHNVMSYYKNTFRRGTAGYQEYYEDFNRYLLTGASDILYQYMMSDYAKFMTATAGNYNSFTFMSYLYYIGFDANNTSFFACDGLFWKMDYHHTGSTFTTEYDYLDVVHINSRGQQQSSTAAYIEDRVWRKQRYFTGSGYSNKYLVFLQPNSDYVMGNYSMKYLATNFDNVWLANLYNQLPWEYKYDDAISSNTLGYCNPSW